MVLNPAIVNPGGKGVAGVVNADIWNAGAGAYPLLDVLQALEVCPWLPAPDHPRVVGEPGRGAQDIHRRLTEILELSIDRGHRTNPSRTGKSGGNMSLVFICPSSLLPDPCADLNAQNLPCPQ